MPPEDTPDDYMTTEEYHQGYMDAHPFNQDCEVCFGTGWEHDEIEGSRRCLDCQPTLVEKVMILKRDVEQAKNDAEQLENEYLRQHGWSYSSKYPGGYWMWSKMLPDGRTVNVPTPGAASNIQESLTPDPEEEECETDCRNVPN